MTRALRVFPDYPWTGTPLEELKMWRREMEAQLSRGQGNLMGLMFARNRVRTWRDELAPGEWFACPACGGRGLWVDGDGTNCYCVQCAWTGILLTCEQAELGSRKTIGEETLRGRRRAWMLRCRNQWSTMFSRRRP